MELTMLPPEKEIEVKPLDDERAAVFVFTEMAQVSRPRPPPTRLFDSQSVRVPGSVPGTHTLSSRLQLPPESVADEDGKKKKVIPVLVLALCHVSQSPTSSLFTHRKSEKGNTITHIIWQSPPETHRHRTHTSTSNRCIATRPHQPPLRTSLRQVELHRSLTPANVVLCEKSAMSLPVRRVGIHRVRNAARCVLSLTSPERAPLSHHHLRLPHSDESRSMDGL